MSKQTNKIDDGGSATIHLLAGGDCIVSVHDFSMLSKSKWRIGANGYVYRRGGRTKGVACLMHRIILQVGPDEHIHHFNGNKLDNRRENLELTTASLHQTEHHSWALTARNRASRVHATHALCVECGHRFKKHRDHRGSQVACSKKCALKRALAARLRKVGQ